LCLLVVLAQWIGDEVNNEKIFPVDEGMSKFPADFAEVAHKIFTRIFRVYAIIYHSHFDVRAFARRPLAFLFCALTPPARSFLHAALRGAGSGVSPQHVIQALYLLCAHARHAGGEGVHGAQGARGALAPAVQLVQVICQVDQTKARLRPMLL
jgi:hypothetical protein